MVATGRLLAQSLMARMCRLGSRGRHRRVRPDAPMAATDEDLDHQATHPGLIRNAATGRATFLSESSPIGCRVIP